MKRLSNDVKSLDLTGMAMAVHPSGQPVMIELDGGRFVVVCSTRDKMEAVLDRIDIRDYRMKQITEGRDFVDSVLFPGSPVRLMVDPYIHEGNTRFTEVFPNKPAEAN